MTALVDHAIGILLGVTVAAAVWMLWSWVELRQAQKLFGVSPNGATGERHD